MQKNPNVLVTELASISVTLNNLEIRVADQQRDHITEFTTLEIAELGAIRHKMRQCAGALGTFAEHAHNRMEQ